MRDHLHSLSLHERMRIARDNAGRRHAQLAHRIGVARRAIADFEDGKESPRRAVILAWGIYCGVPLHWLIDSSLEEPRRCPVCGE